MSTGGSWMVGLLMGYTTALGQFAGQDQKLVPPLEQVLANYQDLSGKTILRPSEFPAPPAESALPLQNSTDMERLERYLAKVGVQVVQDGPHFVWILPQASKELFSNVRLRGWEFYQAATNASGRNLDVIPAGAINFPSTDLEYVLEIYSELRQRTILRPTYLKGGPVHLKTACPLTKDEAIYAMTVVLGLNGLEVVDDGEKFVRVGQQGQWKKIKANAPKPIAGEELLNPKNVPSLGETATDEPMSLSNEVSHQIDRARKLFFDFMHQQDPQTRLTERLFHLYAELVGKEALPSPVGSNLIKFAIKTPVTKRELLYAIEATFALNDLAIIPVDQKRIRLGNISKVGSDH